MNSIFERLSLFASAVSVLMVCFVAQTAEPQNRGQPAPEQTRKQLPQGVKAFYDLEYVSNGHPRQKLDLYLPEKGENLPLVIWIHGGAWLEGSKENCPALFLVSDGYAVASINYRLSQHSTYPAQIQDCKAAVRWLRANAPKYGIDPNRFGVWGASAGGHLSALLGVCGETKEFDTGEYLNVSSQVQAVCDWFGPTDFLEIGKFPSTIDHYAKDSPESKLLGGPVLEKKELVAKANPITFITKKAPPFLIMHGTKDMLVPINQSELLYDALKKAGVEVEFVRIEGAGHGFGDKKYLLQVKEFFDKHLKKKS